MDESLKRQGFQGKVAVQDGVSCPSTMTLTWLGFGGPGWGWDWSQPQGLGGLDEMGWQPGQGCSQLLSERLDRGTGGGGRVMAGCRVQELQTVYLGSQLTSLLYIRQSALLLLL